MTLDLAKLTPAPWNEASWAKDHGRVTTPCGGFDVGEGRAADAEFIAIARNALDVMMRRGWYAVPCNADAVKWIVVNAFAVQLERGGNTGTYFTASDPFTALVAADDWFKANGKGK